MALKKWQVAILTTVFLAAQVYLCYREPTIWLIGMTALYLAGGLKFHIR